MNRHTLPRALFSVLVAGAAAAQSAAALPPSSDTLPPVKAYVVDDATLAGLTGKYMGANMLVGLRIDVTSTLHNAHSGSAHASGTLQVRRNATGGFDVAVDTRSGAEAGAGGGPTPTGVVSGGRELQVNGIGQVAQIAGDRNALSNLTAINFTTELPGTAGFNGQMGSEATAGEMTARITFLDNGVNLDLTSPGANIGQYLSQAGTGSEGRIMQIGQIFGNDIAASNRLQLTLLSEQMSTQMINQQGIQQAMAGIIGL